MTATYEPFLSPPSRRRTMEPLLSFEVDAANTDVYAYDMDILAPRIRRQWLACRPASTPHAKSTFQPQITKWHDNRLLPAERPRTLGTHLPRSATLFYRVVAERALPINHRDARNRYGISVTDTTTSMGFLCGECAILGTRRVSPATWFRTEQGAKRQRHRLLLV